MTPNLHVALALALGRPTSESDAALLDRVRALAAEPQPTEAAFVDVPLFDLEDA